MLLGVLRRTTVGAAGERIAEVVEQLVATVRTLGGAVFQLRTPTAEESVERTLRSVVGAAARARHAGATSTAVLLAVGPDAVTLTVADDGSGPPADLVRGDGLTNLEQRAAAVGGTSRLRPGTTRGAVLEWTVPTPRSG